VLQGGAPGIPRRNGEWEYQALGADKTPNPNANRTACFQLPQAQATQDMSSPVKAPTAR